jgi:hypothetical protein
LIAIEQALDDVPFDELAAFATGSLERRRGHTVDVTQAAEDLPF